MKANSLILVLGSLGLGALLTFGSAAWTQDEPPPQPDQAPADGASAQQEGVEVLARGPVHEAFAEPVVRGPRPSPVVPKKPPDPIEELPPDQKPAGDNVQWIPGYWAWDDDRADFLWVSGVWRDVPPGQQWVPGQWSQVEDGWQWVPGYWTSQEQTETDYLPEPPDPIVEAVSSPTSADETYVPGCWMYRETRYLWRPGFWIQNRPGWIWNPAYYVWSPAGYIFVDGYWDYPLQTRGLLFAPVAVDRRWWGRPNWVYRPSYVIGDQFLLGALFVRPHNCHYYFGDYFEPEYARRGFVSWVDFRIGRETFDPLLNYYRWQFRDNPRWTSELRQLYVARREGQVARPPRTLIQQNTLIRNTTVNNFTINNAVNIANLGKVPPVVHLTKIDRKAINLQPVRASQLTEVRKGAQQMREASVQRAKVEARVAAQGNPRERTAPLRVELPRTRPAVRPATVGTRTPPPAPTPPRLQAHQPTPAERGQPPVEKPRVPVRPGTGRAPEERPRPGTERPTAEPPRRPTPEPRPAEPRPAPRPSGTRPAPEPRPAPRPATEPKPAPRPATEPKPAPRPAPPANRPPAPEAHRPAEAPHHPAPTPEPRPAPTPHPTRPPEVHHPQVPPTPHPAPQPHPAQPAGIHHPEAPHPAPHPQPPKPPPAAHPQPPKPPPPEHPKHPG
jgi:hypothetical protein